MDAIACLQALNAKLSCRIGEQEKAKGSVKLNP